MWRNMRSLLQVGGDCETKTAKLKLLLAAGADENMQGILWIFMRERILRTLKDAGAL